LKSSTTSTKELLHLVQGDFAIPVGVSIFDSIPQHTGLILGEEAVAVSVKALERGLDLGTRTATDSSASLTSPETSTALAGFFTGDDVLDVAEVHLVKRLGAPADGFGRVWIGGVGKAFEGGGVASGDGEFGCAG
jgi:hypothetical protein